MKLITILKKNIKYLKHHLFSTIIVLLGPLFLIIFATIAFNSVSLHGVVIGVVQNSDDDNFISNNLLEGIEKEGYSIDFINEIDICKDKLKNNNVHVCIEEKGKVIRFFVEPSKINLVYIVLNFLSSQIESVSDELKYELTTNLIGKISDIHFYLLSSSDYFEDLINDTEMLSFKLNQVSNSISSMEIDVDFDNINIQEIKIANQENKIMIFNFEQEVDLQLNNSINKLILFDEMAFLVEQDIKQKKEARNDIDEELNTAFNNYDCNEADYYDLTLYYSEPDTILDLLNNSEKPECSYVYSMKSALDQCTGDLNQASDDIRIIRLEINSSIYDLINFKENSSELFENTKQYFSNLDLILNETEGEIENIKSDVSNIDNSKNQLNQELNLLNSNINENKVSLNKFYNDFKNVSLQLDDISKIDSKDLVHPVINQVEGFDKSRSNIDYLFPTLIVFIIMFVGILLGNILISKERKSRAFFRNIISPTHSLILPFGAYLTSLMIILLQVFVIFILCIIILPISIYIFPFELFIIILFGCSIFILIGIILGNIIESEETLIIISILLTIILLIFSNVLLPIEVIPPFLHFMIKLNPFYIVSEILSKQLINGIEIKLMLLDFIKLLFYFSITFILSLITFDKNK
jgi:ABC-type multidrug transport system permease subunit